MKSSTPLSIWLNFLKQHWFVYSFGVLTVVLTGCMQVLGTLVLGWTLDYFTGDPVPAFFNRWEGQDVFWALFWFLFISRILLTIGRIGWRLTLARKTHSAAAFLRRWIWQQVRYFSKDDLNQKWTKGVLMNASNSDVNAARFIFGFTLVAVIDVIFLGLFTLWAMVHINPTLTVWSIATLLFLPIIIKKLSDREMDRYRVAQDALSDFNDLSSQVVSTIRLQRLTQTGSFWEKLLLKSAETYRQSRLKAVFTSLLFIPAMGMGSVLSYIVLFALGISYVLEGTMTIGDFVAMQGLIFLLQGPLMELGFMISDGKKGHTSLERLNQIYTEKLEPSLFKGHLTSVDDGAVISARGLRYQFSGGPVLFENIDITLERGDRLGIIGPIGAGKTILIEILAGLRRDYQGELKFYGQSFDDYTHDTLRSEICLVAQKPFLFAESIKRNLLMDLEGTDEECWYALELAGLKKDVLSFKDQLETPLGEWGLNLSGGQKQRLTLARALMRKPRVLILDDCLSAVDTVTEELILNNLNKHLTETTLIWVAHRRSTLKYCRKLLELSGPQVDESESQYHEVQYE